MFTWSKTNNSSIRKVEIVMSYEKTLLESTGLALIPANNINDATEDNPIIDP